MVTKTIGELNPTATAAAEDLIEMERAADGVSFRISKTEWLDGIDQEIAAARVAGPFVPGDPPASLAEQIAAIGGDVLNVKIAGAVGDGVTDDTAAIQAAVDNVATGTIVYFPPGTYLVSEVIVPADTTLFAYKNVTIRNVSIGTHALNVQGRNVLIRGLKFEGTYEAMATNAGAHGILLNLEYADLDSIRIEQCEFAGLYSAIRIKSYTTTGSTAKHIFIVDNYFHTCGGRALDCSVSIDDDNEGVAYSLDNIHFERNTLADMAPEASGDDSPLEFPGAQGNNGAINIGTLSSVTTCYVCDNAAYRCAPQFMCMGNPGSTPRTDFVIRGNTVRQNGTNNAIHMGFQLYGIDNLIFDGNSIYYVTFECVLMANCTNFKIANCHFEDANIGIAITDLTSYHNTTGEIVNCTFVDCECPTSENNGHNGIRIESDAAEMDISNCRFTRVNGTKAQSGISTDYDNAPPRYTKNFDTTDYQWVLTSSSTYYLRMATGVNPRISLPATVYETTGTPPTDLALTLATVTGNALSGAGTWGYDKDPGNAYKTIYVRLSDNAAPGNNEIRIGYPRYAIAISNCRMEGLTVGVDINSASNTNYPGAARVSNSSFRSCDTAVSLERTQGSVVMGCVFTGCGIDVEVSGALRELRACYNSHINTNPMDDSAKGAYVVTLDGSASLHEISSCWFNNVKNVHVRLGSSFALRLRMLLWYNNNVDSLSTPLPLVTSDAAISMLTNADRVLAHASAMPAGGSSWKIGDLILNSDPATTGGEQLGNVMLGSNAPANSMPIQASMHYQTFAGNPTSNLTPNYVGEEVYNSTHQQWFKAHGTSSTSWKPATASYQQRNGTPVGNLTATFIGELALDQSTNQLWMATATGTGGWKQITV